MSSIDLRPLEQRVGLACRPGPVDDELAATLAYAAALGAPVLVRRPQDLLTGPVLTLLTLDEPWAAVSSPDPVTGDPVRPVVILAADRLAELAPVATRLLASGQASAVAVYARTPADVARVAAELPVSYVATALSVADRRGDPVVTAAREHGARPVLLSPLCGGRLTQQAAAEPPTDGLAGLFELATRLSIGPARLALAWLLARYPDALILPRTSRVTHAEMNLAALDLALPTGVLAELTALFD